MGSQRRLCFLVMGAIAALSGGCAQHGASPVPLRPSSSPAEKTAAPSVHTALHFEENRGQFEASVRYIARTPGQTVLLAPDAITFSPWGEVGATDQVRMSFVGANRRPDLRGVDLLPGFSNYFRDPDPSKWVKRAPHYGRVRYQDVYDGIDLVFYGNRSELEYDLVVRSGATADVIQLSFSGAAIEIEPSGDLLLRSGAGELRHRKPLVYQTIDNDRRAVAANYEAVDDHTVRIALADYDPSEELIIDPRISFSSFLGGRNNDFGMSMALDPDGNIYVVGGTSSSDFPRESPWQRCSGSCDDAFVTKLSPDGSTLLYSTFIGGGDVDQAMAVTVNGAGEAWIAGWTTSSDFPTRVPLYDAPVGDVEVWVARMAADGSDLLYATYIGGSERDRPSGIAVDGAGDVWIVGETVSDDFPVESPLQAQHGSPGVDPDGFVLKLAADGSRLLFSTFLGGSESDRPKDLALDSSGEPVIVGSTSSANFPLTNPLQSTIRGVDAYITKLAADGSAFRFSTFFGGSASDWASSVALNSVDDVAVFGSTRSNDFPILAPFQSTLQGTNDLFLSKITKDGSTLIFSSFLGGSNSDVPADYRGLTVDEADNLYLVGRTWSPDFPLVDPVQPAFASPPGLDPDGIVVKVLADGSALAFSTFYGGTGNDFARGIAVRPSGLLLFSGYTDATDFPNDDPVQPTLGGGDDAFIVQISIVDAAMIGRPQRLSLGEELTTTLTIENDGIVDILDVTAVFTFDSVNLDTTAFVPPGHIITSAPLLSFAWVAPDTLTVTFLNPFAPGDLEIIQVINMFAKSGPAISCQSASITYSTNPLTHQTDPDEVTVGACVEIIDESDLPPPVTGLLAVKSGIDRETVDVVWDEATDPITFAYDLWKVVDGDGTLIPFANLPTATTDNRVLGVCLDVPLSATPSCIGASAFPTSAGIIFYQARGLNRDGFEGIDHRH